MSNYAKITDYAAKDVLLTGNPSKIVKGTELGADFDAVAVAVATKANSASPVFTGVSSFAVGAVGAPSIYMTGYATTGWYNIGANNWGFAVSGAKVLDISSTGLAVTGALSATGTLTLSGTGQIIVATAASAADKYVTISNTNGTLEYGVSAGGEGFIGTITADNLNLQVNGSVVGTVSSTGLAVTGGLSATGVANFLGGDSLGLTIRSNGLTTEEFNGTDSIIVNFNGYLNGTTQYRGFKIYNGKQGLIGDFSSTGLAVTGTTSTTSFFETTEIAAPAAGAANTARIFAVDNGSGKTVLKVQFATGAAQIIATEP